MSTRSRPGSSTSTSGTCAARSKRTRRGPITSLPCPASATASPAPEPDARPEQCGRAGSAKRCLWGRVAAFKGGETMSSQRLLVTVEAESGSSQVALLGDIPIARLVPQLLEVCRVQGVEETNQWIVRRDGHL